MRRRQFLRDAGALSLIGALAGSGAHAQLEGTRMASPGDKQPPNFVIIITDQHPWNLLGCAGDPVLKTPNLDRLAASGVRFDRCYTIHPLCMPTRATWFTGMTPRGHRTRCNGIPLDPTLPTIAQSLSEAGYATHGIGKLHFRTYGTLRGADPKALDPQQWCESRWMWQQGRIKSIPVPYYGLQSVEFIGGNGPGAYGDYIPWLLEREPNGPKLFSEAIAGVTGEGVERTWGTKLPAELHYVGWMAERAEAFVQKRAASKQPFFLWLSIPNPHPPYTAPQPWCNMYRPEDVLMPIRREGELDSLPPHYRMFFEKGGQSAGRFAATNVPDDQIRRVRAMVYGMVSQIDDAVGRVVRAVEQAGLAERTVVVFMADHGNMLGNHWMFNMPPTHLDSVLRVPSIWSLPGRFRQNLVSSALVSHLDFAPTILDLAGLPIPEGFAPSEPEARQQLPPWPGHSLVPLLTGQADSVQDSVIAENDEDYLGLRLRTLITDDYHLTAYPGHPYGELYDLRQDPNQLHNLWDDPERQGLKRELQARLMERLALTDNVLPRRLCHA